MIHFDSVQVNKDFYKSVGMFGGGLMYIWFNWGRLSILNGWVVIDGLCWRHILSLRADLTFLVGALGSVDFDGGGTGLTTLLS